MRGWRVRRWRGVRSEEVVTVAYLHLIGCGMKVRGWRMRVRGERVRGERVEGERTYAYKFIHTSLLS